MPIRGSTHLAFYIHCPTPLASSAKLNLLALLLQLQLIFLAMLSVIYIRVLFAMLASMAPHTVKT